MLPKSILFALFAVLAVTLVAAQSDERLAELESAADDMGSAVSGDNNPTTLQKLLAELVERIRVRVQDRHQSAQDLLEKVKEITGKLHDLHVSKGEKVQALVERLQGRIKELVEKAVDRFTNRPRNTRSITSDEELLEQLGIENLLVESFIRSQVEEARNSLNRHRREANQPRQDPLAAIREMFEKIRGHLLGRYKEFINWLVTVWKNGIGQAKNQHARLLAIAREVIADAKDMHKETLREALELLKPYKEELGSIWGELTNSVNKALKQ